MWIDSHCHLDASEFDGLAPSILQRAAQQGVTAIVIPAVQAANFQTVRNLAHAASTVQCAYALGIHPLYTEHATPNDLIYLREVLQSVSADPRLVAIGEIGLDFFGARLASTPLREKQEYFYSEQLKLAQEFNLPVILHVRRAQDRVLKYLRRTRVNGGIAHAFNGSRQQAQAFLELGLKCGFGGAMTFSRALQIRRLAADLPETALVLETDAPDIPPAWLAHDDVMNRQTPLVNTPEQLPRIAQTLAQLRATPIDRIAQLTYANTCEALPRLRELLNHAVAAAAAF